MPIDMRAFTKRAQTKRVQSVINADTGTMKDECLRLIKAVNMSCTVSSIVDRRHPTPIHRDDCTYGSI